MPQCTFELFLNDAWLAVATLDVTRVEIGHASPSRLNYDDLYALDHYDAADHRAVSCACPANLDLYSRDSWPAFVLDILPAGAGRAALLASLDVRDSVSEDWRLLLLGAGNPPGNLRVAKSVKANVRQKGFTQDEVTAHRP